MKLQQEFTTYKFCPRPFSRTAVLYYRTTPNRNGKSTLFLSHCSKHRPGASGVLPEVRLCCTPPNSGSESDTDIVWHITYCSASCSRTPPKGFCCPFPLRKSPIHLVRCCCCCCCCGRHQHIDVASPPLAPSILPLVVRLVMRGPGHVVTNQE